ncbi:hypothetical protein PAMC26510_25650 [Caballeronia sordidicola]|uniref:Uncharacterized protein n=1 Tax=Caballeronia sordidicola TaxID=196367 RepID=A0A242MGF6_CABSO|nr:hypothetical protein PAMC26510_25650 [Caballeronia sordidicola]
MFLDSRVECLQRKFVSKQETSKTELVDGSIGVGQLDRFELDFSEVIKTGVTSHFLVEAGGA